jgi:hypothetical protein
MWHKRRGARAAARSTGPGPRRPRPSPTSFPVGLCGPCRFPPLGAVRLACLGPTRQTAHGPPCHPSGSLSSARGPGRLTLKRGWRAAGASGLASGARTRARMAAAARRAAEKAGAGARGRTQLPWTCGGTCGGRAEGARGRTPAWRPRGPRQLGLGRGGGPRGAVWTGRGCWGCLHM